MTGLWEGKSKATSTFTVLTYRNTETGMAAQITSIGNGGVYNVYENGTLIGMAGVTGFHKTGPSDTLAVQVASANAEGVVSTVTVNPDSSVQVKDEAGTQFNVYYKNGEMVLLDEVTKGGMKTLFYNDGKYNYQAAPGGGFQRTNSFGTPEGVLTPEGQFIDASYTMKETSKQEIDRNAADGQASAPQETPEYHQVTYNITVRDAQGNVMVNNTPLEDQARKILGLYDRTYLDDANGNPVGYFFGTDFKKTLLDPNGFVLIGAGINQGDVMEYKSKGVQTRVLPVDGAVEKTESHKDLAP